MPLENKTHHNLVISFPQEILLANLLPLQRFQGRYNDHLLRLGFATIELELFSIGFFYDLTTPNIRISLFDIPDQEWQQLKEDIENLDGRITQDITPNNLLIQTFIEFPNYQNFLLLIEALSLNS